VHTLREQAAARGIPHVQTEQVLHEWRTTVHERDFGGSQFTAEGLLSDKMVELVASVGPLVQSREGLEQVLGREWKWYSKYGAELLDYLKEQDIPPMVSKPKKPKGKKRANEQEVVSAREARKPRVDQTAALAPRQPPRPQPNTSIPASLRSNPYAALLSQPSSSQSAAQYWYPPPPSQPQ
jgi:hypothetical protein